MVSPLPCCSLVDRPRKSLRALLTPKRLHFPGCPWSSSRGWGWGFPSTRVQPVPLGMSAFQEGRERPWSPPPGAPLACLLGEASGPQQWGAALHPWTLRGSCLDWRDQSPWGFPPAPLPHFCPRLVPSFSVWASHRGPGLLLEGQHGRDTRALPGPWAGLCHGVPQEDPSQPLAWRILPHSLGLMSSVLA